MPGYAHRAVLVVPEDEETAAPGGAITTELCGRWEHEPPCRYPHVTEVVARDADRVTVRTLFACEPAEVVSVRARISDALDRWTVLDEGPDPGPDSLGEWAARHGYPAAPA
ncbi:hypothetical protein [Pseudonocardia alaniniphila]|uniref:Uncharacterized protein n=1 Tax=Pseudonocardia alaniniphila TaxID=75291 RepID=A0ABS9TCS3_9PSEU|nr:hypothetical protein [Pseudonocardia alaniniphila]MCH6166193.1 hypothetical protein [Pseudonocardia alaniniphila]